MEYYYIILVFFIMGLKSGGDPHSNNLDTPPMTCTDVFEAELCWRVSV